MRPIDADALKEKFAEILESTYTDDYAKGFVNGLCAALNMPTITPPNEPLTLEQLREMDGEPVWFDTIKRWGIVRVCGYGISVLTKSGEYDVTRMKFYRRPPEGEEDI